MSLANFDEQSLRDRAVEYETVFEHVAEGVVLASLDGRYLRWNPAALDLYGFGPGGAPPRTFAELRELVEVAALDGAVLAPDEWPLARILRGERLRGVELRVRDRGGRWSRVLSYAGALARDGDRPLMAVLTVTDVTQREAQAERLRDGERQLSLVLAGSNDGFWDFEPNRMRFVVSPRCLELVGAPPETQTFSPGFWWDRAHPDEIAELRGAIVAHLRGRTPRLDVEFRLRHADGGWRWVRALGMAVERDGAGRAVRVSGTLRDLTERHEDRERLRTALAANEALVEELRAALQNVKTLSGLLPVCAWCRKVRDDQGYWKRLESYISERSDAQFSHAMCPDCYAREYPTSE